MYTYSLSDKIILSIFCVVMVYLIFLLFVIVPLSARTSRICAENGWPYGYVYFNMDKYCVREINETEYICQLEDVVVSECVIDK